MSWSTACSATTKTPQLHSARAGRRRRPHSSRGTGVLRRDAQGCAGPRGGCSCVLKPAEETPSPTLSWRKIFREATADGVFNVITGYGETAGAALAAHAGRRQDRVYRVDGVDRLIVKAAAGNLKRLTLELGGKSPLIMFDDANLDKAIMNASLGLLAGSGQNCSCTSRIYVQRGIYDQVVEGIAGFAKMLPMGAAARNPTPCSGR